MEGALRSISTHSEIQGFYYLYQTIPVEIVWVHVAMK